MKRPLSNKRYLMPSIKGDLKEKMVFIGGPRQVGKTTLALELLGSRRGEQHPAYFNWDIAEARAKMRKNEIPSKQPLIVFDEFHKFSRWRQTMKGFYDLYYPKKNAIVTGSARLDYYRKGGDSLVGRYHYYRLHPYSLRELNTNPTRSDLETLLQFGGFPEPLSRGSTRHWRRWQKERTARVIQTDLRDLERVNEISLIELLVDALSDRVGSPLSLQSIREDLEVSHDSVRRWIRILENIYLCFRISPYGSPKIKAVKKEQKLYFWDWSTIPDKAIRFENLVACQLQKYCHFMEDTEGYRMELRYIRDVDKREVDFVVLKEKKPLFAVECKSGERSISPHVSYFRKRTPIPKFFQVHLGQKDFGDEDQDARVLPFLQFVKELSLP